jgi:hypothetical protein
VIGNDALECEALAKLQNDSRSDLIEQIPEPNTVRGWLVDSIRRTDLLRSLLRLAVRKAAYQRPMSGEEHGVRRD